MKKGEVELVERLVKALDENEEKVLRMDFVTIMERLVTKLEEERRNKLSNHLRGVIESSYVDADKISINDDVILERYRQDHKWGKQRHDYGKWLAILMEEVGEVAEAVGPLMGLKSGKESDSNNLYVELIQVAAVACAIAEQVAEGETNRKCEHKHVVKIDVSDPINPTFKCMDCGQEEKLRRVGE